MAFNRLSELRKDVAFTLSNGGLTATHTAANNNSRGGLGLYPTETGKKYFEVTFVTAGTNDNQCGLVECGVNETQDFANRFVIMMAGGQVRNPANSVLFSFGTMSSGDVVQWAVDFDARVAWVRVNDDTDWNDDPDASPTTGVGGFDISAICGAGVYPYYHSGVGGTEITFNFGDSEFQFVVPDGFEGWAANTTEVLVDPSTFFDFVDNDVSATIDVSTEEAGRLVVLAVFINDETVTVTGISDDAGLTWNEITNFLPANLNDLGVGTARMVLYWAYAAEQLTSDTVTVTLSDSSQVVLTTVTVQNANAQTPLDASNDFPATAEVVGATELDFDQLTTLSGEQCYLLCFAGCSSTSGQVQPSSTHKRLFRNNRSTGLSYGWLGIHSDSGFSNHTFTAQRSSFGNNDFAGVVIAVSTETGPTTPEAAFVDAAEFTADVTLGLTPFADFFDEAVFGPVNPVLDPTTPTAAFVDEASFHAFVDETVLAPPPVTVTIVNVTR